jgi:uncharacterized protein YdiU (UPF0061 family)
MRQRSADFTNTFTALTSGRLVEEPSQTDQDLDAWQQRWQARRGRQPQSPAEVAALMRQHNPAFIPRNHNVEAALSAATTSHDFTVMERLLEVLRTPYDHERDLPLFSAPGPREHRYRTFCGT